MSDQIRGFGQLEHYETRQQRAFLTVAAHLGQIRVIQDFAGRKNPFMCFACCRFLILKLLGFVRERSTLNDFLNSTWAKSSKYSREALANLWGGENTAIPETPKFNKEVLPAVINDLSSGVGRLRNDNEPDEVKIAFADTDTSNADTMLHANVPLMAGITLGKKSGRRGHFIVIVQNTDGAVWAVDPWPGEPGVVCLDSKMSFKKPQTKQMAIGELTIPCSPPWFGFCCNPDLPADSNAYKLKIKL